jgi:cyclic beta-1,2-glucan synthetase
VSAYTITVENPNHAGHGVTAVELDGAACPAANPITLVDDGQAHALRIVLG